MCVANLHLKSWETFDVFTFVDFDDPENFTEKIDLRTGRSPGSLMLVLSQCGLKRFSSSI